tara:strand:+ start:272 stop:403 length:132 start_codon:yes stop_codon:yes gene_type:complete
MRDSDHNAFVSMYADTECENPFDEVMSEWEDWEDEEHPRYWWV